MTTNSRIPEGARHLFHQARPAACPKAAAGALLFVLFVSAGCSFFQARPGGQPQLRKEIVSIALQYRGAPYRWRGNTSKGFDCSGFVQFVFKAAGVHIPRTSKRQFSSGDAVDRSELRRGDLVFFTRWNWLKFLLPPNHVGIYIGSHRFVHAPSAGQTVRLDSLESHYWQSRYKGSRNLL